MEKDFLNNWKSYRVSLYCRFLGVVYIIIKRIGLFCFLNEVFCFFIFLVIKFMELF